MTELDDGLLVTERYDKTLRYLPVDDGDDDLLAAVVVCRLCSFYLSPIWWGYISFRWLKGQDFL